MAEALQQELDRINDLLNAESITPYRIGIADPRVMVAAPINAHFMSKRVYDQLVDNIKKDGNLGSLPFCWHEVKVEDGVARTAINILSGHHRIEAAAAAGVQRILYLYTNAKLTQSERIAIQLSHNAIHGEDDINILRMQWESLESLQDKLYAGLDDDFFKSFDPVVLNSFNEQDIDFEAIELLFLPTELERLARAMEEIGKSKRARYAASLRQYEEFTAALMRYKDAAQIFNSATAFAVMVEATVLYCDYLEKEQPADWGEVHEQVSQGAKKA
jgi:hypothetical protein